MSETKYCKKCDRYLDVSEFYNLKVPCKDCKLKYQKEYFINNKEKIKIYQKSHYNTNREEIIKKQLIRDSFRKEEISASQKIYRANNKDKFFLYRKKKSEKPEYRLRQRISNSVYQTLKFANSSKNCSTFLVLNYSVHDLKAHLESLFEPWMNWDNWGAYDPKTWDDNDTSTWTWQIDHIIPQSSLPFSSLDDENFKKVWALDNLRPLSSKQNIYDGSNKVRHIKGKKS